MSFYFAIVGTKDNPLFEHEFGTSRQGGDGNAHFRDDARQMNQFVVHSSLDIVEELQWNNGAMYMKTIDRFHSSHVSCFLTGTGVKFLLLHNAEATLNPASRPVSAASGTAAAQRGTTAINPPNPASEEAIRQFYTEVFELWCKTSMNPFYRIDMEIKSQVFRQRVAAAAKRYL